MTQALLSIGSNQNNPHLQIELAFSKLRSRFSVITFSSLYETQPVGGVSQDSFINAAICLETSLEPQELLDILMGIERDAGRNRTTEVPKGPRNLDLDIILFGEEVKSGYELSIPHPRFRDRRFVLEPLMEIAPQAVDPVSKKTISQLLKECDDISWVNPVEESLVQ